MRLTPMLPFILAGSLFPALAQDLPKDTPREWATLLAGIQSRRERVEEILKEAAGDCGTSSRKFREMRGRYGDLREEVNGFYELLAMDLQTGQDRPETFYKGRVTKVADAVDALKAYHRGTTCDGKAEEAGAKGELYDSLVGSPVRKLQGFLDQRKEDREARKQALLTYLKAIRWKPLDELVKPTPPQTPQGQGGTPAQP